MESRKLISIIIIIIVVTAGLGLLFFVDYGEEEDDERLSVVASFYPLYYFADYIGGDNASVSLLIPDNVEPHSWSPSVSDLVAVSKTDVFIYNGHGFEPWIDSFTDQLKEGVTTVDTSEGMDVLYDDETVSELDPHFWLDPLAAAVQAENIADAMVAADPDHAAYYQDNCGELVERLVQLDADFKAGLENKTKDVIVTTHEGFDYMALRYNFTAYGAVGISGEDQPSAGEMADLVDLVEELDIDYIYSEPLFDDAIMQQISDETGAEVLILDGVHGRSGPHADMDYFEIMYENLESLRKGLEVAE
jgi:zinc transport system substrate-binding protein